MNNRQAGAFREMVRKEEKARENWSRTNTQRLEAYAQTRGLSSRGSRPRSRNGPEEERRVRTIQVPYTKTVRVPVQGTGLVQVKVNKPVARTRLVEVPAYKDVREEYSVIEKRPSVRKKEIWVKKMVPEKYMKQVEVPRSRIVRVPSKKFQEVEAYETRTVTEGRPMSVEGYRVDEILPDGSRIRGQEVFHPDDHRVAGIPLDSRPPSRRVASRPASRSLNRKSPQPRRNPAILNRSLRQIEAKAGTVPRVNLGLRLQTASGERARQIGNHGVLVRNVGHAGPCERAGLVKGDVVQYVNNRPTRSTAEFNEILGSSAGPLHITVARGGPTAFQRLKFTVVR